MPRKDHWDAVYTTKANDEVSWFEADPSLSLDLIKQVSPPPESVIDVGGGQSLLVGKRPGNPSGSCLAQPRLASWARRSAAAVFSRRFSRSSRLRLATWRASSMRCTSTCFGFAAAH